jgi:hypothetical protein
MPFDVNGRPVSVSRWRRLVRRPTADITTEHPDLVPVAGSWDDAVAGSAVLDAAADFRPDAQAVLWHLLDLPAAGIESVLALVAQDGYTRVVIPTVPEPPAGRLSFGPVAVARVQLVDALHIAQQRSRMASVAARHGGQALGWQVLQIPG